VWQLNEIPLFILLGLIMGMWGGTWNSLSKHLMTFRFKNIFANKHYRFLEVMAVVLLTASIRIGMPLFFEDC